LTAVEKELAETKSALDAAQATSVATVAPASTSSDAITTASADAELQSRYDALLAEKQAWDAVRP
jgi:hypothetical protein